MVMKYHINKQHEVKECRTNLMPCHLNHYDTIQEAHKESERLLEKEHKLREKINIINKAAQKEIHQKNLLNQEILASLSSDTKLMIVSALKKMDKNNNKHSMWNAIYDSSPAGQLELQRVRSSDKEQRIIKAENVKQHIKNLNMMNSIKLDEYNVNMSKNSFSNQEHSIVEQSSSVLNDAKKKMALISASWMSKLTVEEIDTIHWITGHGAGILNKHLIGEKHPSAGNYTQEFLNEKAELFKKAMEKAPELDEPIVFYRGTKYRHIINDELNNVASSSYGANVAKNFANNKPNAVIMEIKTKKIASVVAMSEWGDTEIEMLAPLGKYKKINEFTNSDGHHIVQLEYID